MPLARFRALALLTALASLAAPLASAESAADRVDPAVDGTGPRCEDVLSDSVCEALRHCLLSDPLCDEITRLLSTNCNDLLAENLCSAVNESCDGVVAESICDRIADPPALPLIFASSAESAGPVGLAPMDLLPAV